MTDYAREHALDLKALYNYHWLLRKKGLLGNATDTANFISVTRTVPRPECTIVFPNGIQVTITVHADALPSLLKQVTAL